MNMSISTRCWCYQKGRKDAHLEPALAMGSGGFTTLCTANHQHSDDKKWKSHKAIDNKHEEEHGFQKQVASLFGSLCPRSHLRQHAQGYDHEHHDEGHDNGVRNWILVDAPRLRRRASTPTNL